MIRNSIPPTTTLDNLSKKVEVAKGKCYTDIGFWGGVVPGNAVCDLDLFHLTTFFFNYSDWLNQ